MAAEIWHEKGDVDGSDIGNGLVDGRGDVVGDNDGLVMEEGAGGRGLRMNEGEGEGRERVFREF